jgi:hypothetical protein
MAYRRKRGMRRRRFGSPRTTRRRWGRRGRAGRRRVSRTPRPGRVGYRL